MIDPSLVSVALQLNSDGTDTDIITVPTGYKAAVSMLFLSNTNGSTGSVEASWYRSHTDTAVPFLGTKSLSSGDFLRFSSTSVNDVLLMREGDIFSASCGSGDTITAIMTVQLLRDDAPSYLD